MSSFSKILRSVGMYSLVILFAVFSFSILAKPLIEGGKKIPLTEIKYIDSIKLDLPDNSSCSGTRVAHNKILTAAHCVINSDLSPKLSSGNILLRHGTVTDVKIHPIYKSSLKERIRLKPLDTKIKQKEDELQLKRGTAFDIAIINTDRKKSKRTRAYPKVINENHNIINRSKIEIVGFGTHKLSYNAVKNKFNHDYEADQSERLAQTEWATCPQVYGESFQAEDLSQQINSILAIKNKTVHTISNFIERRDHEKAMVLKGDSGSGVLEYDKDGNMIVTAVASKVILYTEGRAQANLKITLPNGKVEKITFEEFPENWGYAKKSDSEFPEIKKELSRLGIDIKTKGLKIERSYIRHSMGHFADLLNPLNQSFLKNNLENQP